MPMKDTFTINVKVDSEKFRQFMEVRDIVEVTRCENCSHYTRSTEFCSIWVAKVCPNDYCSRAGEWEL